LPALPASRVRNTVPRTTRPPASLRALLSMTTPACGTPSALRTTCGSTRGTPCAATSPRCCAPRSGPAADTA
jgi:hypothetical protein